ncbi:hypothetical protein BCV70DRAFT_211706 [Testicularia cyperi]|uniref:Phytanoyl-CoA dioxygenase n=1 Tax=Testicularia cyperi TaxID=1882483 RepID=A0A317XP96_9BASI|nr:hypothetical protein BCV70DRAFT_211706 [Testicularia cyperi]
MTKTASTTEAAERLKALGYQPGSLLEQYHERGYVILDNVFAKDEQSQLSLTSLRLAAQQVVEATRQGRWTQRRTVGSAFPPYDQNNTDSWGVQHIMCPELDTAASADRHSEKTSAISHVFRDFYSSSPLLDIASILIDAPVEKMQMELFNLLINPESHHFALGWHRDDVRPETEAQEERQRLDTPTYGVQFNAALWDDDCLFIVPASHKRLRTAEEKRANLARAPPAVSLKDSNLSSSDCAAFDGNWDVDPPETLRVHLKAGQTVFYSQRILHRASYLPTRKRATLHGCYGDASDPEAGGAERARNVLQHGVEWMRDPAFGTSLPERLRPMWDNLIRMDKAFSNRKLGYSLDNA